MYAKTVYFMQISNLKAVKHLITNNERTNIQTCAVQCGMPNDTSLGNIFAFCAYLKKNFLKDF